MGKRSELSFTFENIVRANAAYTQEGPMRMRVLGLPANMIDEVDAKLRASPVFRGLAAEKPGQPITVTYGKAVRGDPNLKAVESTTR